jgi:myo-inositol-1(or 4)-monophosphatase
MNPEQVIIDLTLHIRDRVRPHLGELQSRRITGTASSGDATFAIDDVAEEAIVQFVEREKLSVAYYSEDKGLVKFGSNPKAVLVIDPIDGTRPAVAGFEQCVVAVSWADYRGDGDSPTMADVRHACVAELKRGDVFYADRGRGVRWIDSSGAVREPALMPVAELSSAPVSFEAVARPFEFIGPCLSEIVNAASMKGGCFLYNSTAYSLTRLLTGQLAGVIDIGNRVLREFPATRDRWVEVGRGKVVALFTYDIAAAVLIATEGGAIVTDAYGRSFDRVPLLDTSEQNLQTICAASNPIIHRALLDAIDRGIALFPPASAVPVS